MAMSFTVQKLSQYLWFEPYYVVLVEPVCAHLQPVTEALVLSSWADTYPTNRKQSSIISVRMSFSILKAGHISKQ